MPLHSDTPSTPTHTSTSRPNLKGKRSVSDVIKQYEAHSSSSRSTSMTNSDFTPDRSESSTPSRIVRRPSGIPSRIPHTNTSESGSPQANGTVHTGVKVESTRDSEEMEALAGPSRLRSSGIGLGAPIGPRNTNSEGPTTPPPRPHQTRPSTTTTTSFIPRPFPQSVSMPRNLSAGGAAAHTSPSPTGRNATQTSLPRSTSDSMNLSRRSSASTEPGPSRLPSPTKRGHPVVAISVSRPTPDKINSNLQTRRKSSKADMAPSGLRSPTSPTSPRRSGIPMPSGSRRPSYRSTSSSVSSQGSASNYYSPGSISSQPPPSPFNFPPPLPATMDLNPPRVASTPMDRGVNSRTRGSHDRVVDLASPTPSPSRGSPRGSPVPAPRGSPRAVEGSSPNKTHQPSLSSIEVPRRSSSSSQRNSPLLGSPPTISPRRSSMNQSRESAVAPERRSSREPDIQESVSSTRTNFGPGMHSRASSASSSSRRSDLTYPHKSASPKVPSSPDSSRRSSFLSRNASHTSPSPSRRTNLASPIRGSPRSSPRKSPGLKINPPPPPLLSRLSSSTSQPSPPVPAKSPLRGLSNPGSAGAQTPVSGSVSGASNYAEAGTPTSAINVLKRMSEVENDIPDKSETPLFNTPFEAQIQPSTAGGPPSQIIETPPADEIRFTTLTVPSVYSQDSAPPSATSWALSEATATSQDSWISDESQGGPRRLDSVSWGQKRGDQSSHAAEDMARSRRSSSLPRLATAFETNKVLPNIPSNTPTSAVTNNSSVVSDKAINGLTSTSPVVENRREPIKSPSLPVMRKEHGALRERSMTSNGPLLPAATLREDGELEPLRPLLPNSPSVVMSKRSHLIREIATTERAYAKDLALIRDAYMYRFLRPVSDHSTHTNGGSATSPGDVSDQSRRSSVLTNQTVETKRSSGYDSLTSSWIVPHTNVTSPLPRSPAEGPGENGSSSYFTSTARTSTTSLHATPQPSPRKGSRASVYVPAMPPPVGKPLAPSDLKTVFLNLDQLAGAADELATAFEQAMGEEDIKLGPSSVRPGEAGSDRLGQVFTAMSQASLHLTQLQADPLHVTYLNDCWNQIKSHTHAWNLDSMLIKPIQRITKYPLLFDDLLLNTTPVHPDYFAIRTAAQMSKAVAVEIDDAKRRQDVVSNAIGNASGNGSKKSLLPINTKNDRQPASSKLLGLKRFRNKDKLTSSNSNSSSSTITLTKSTSTMDLAAPQTISESSMVQLKDLVGKVDELEISVKNIGKEIVYWTAAAKEVLVAQDGLVKIWLKVVQLDPTDLADRRLLEFRRVIDCIVAEAWTELNEEVKSSIIPIFGKLLESSINPRKVITKRESKMIEYFRYQALKSSKKANSHATIDRLVIQIANEFVALHTQLLEELPAFLEGYLRILDIALVAFAKCQSKYHENVKERLGSFATTWLEPPSTPNLFDSPTITSPSAIDGAGGGGALTTPRGIVKAWHDAWAPYAEAMEHFQCTKPGPRSSTRTATFHQTQPPASASASKASTRPPSRSGAPALRHSTSFKSQISLSDLTRAGSPISRERPTNSRMRSSSLRSQTAPAINLTLTAPPSPSEKAGSGSGRFSLLRRSNSKNQVSRDKDKDRQPTRPPLSPRVSELRPTSVGMTEDSSNRLSWGLPKIPQEQSKIFEGIGLSPTKSQSSVLSASSLYYQHSQMRATSDPTPSPSSASGSYDGSKHPFAASARPRSRSKNKNDSRLSLVSNNEIGTGTGAAGLGLGDLGVDDEHMLYDEIPSSPVRRSRTIIPNEIGNGNGVNDTPRKSRGSDMDAAAGWRNEQVLYQCACVADFEPNELGNKRYRGLRFLSMVSGDLIDVFHEVGRIDELPSFPYPQVGVDNDGVLVGRAEDGQIGLVICSFLEPLRD